MKEVWKNVVGFENIYQVSNFGNIIRVSKDSLLKPTLNRYGYLYVSLSNNGSSVKKTVHQIVATAFIGDFNYGDIVNHIDGVKTNNHISNLEKSTTQDNNIHSFKLGLRKRPGSSEYYCVGTVRKKYKDKVYISYVSIIKDKGKVVFKKQFKTEVEAALAVDAYLDFTKDTRRPRNFPKS
jgi:hypothetical protein